MSLPTASESTSRSGAGRQPGGRAVGCCTPRAGDCRGTMYASLNARALGLDLTAVETIGLASSAGFGGVDFLVRDLVEASIDPGSLRARMDDLGLRGGAWPLPVAWRGDAPTFAADLARLPRYAEAAQVLGLSRTGTWVMFET